MSPPGPAVPSSPPAPSPRLRQPLGSRRGFESSPKGRGKAANKAAAKAGTYAPLAPGDGEERRRLPVLARAAGSQPLTSAPASSRGNSESHRSRGDFPAPSCECRLPLAPQPLAQPPPLGKTNPGGGGGPGRCGDSSRRAATLCRPWLGDLGKGTGGGIWAPRLLPVEINEGCAGKDEGIPLSPLLGILWWFLILHTVFTLDWNKTANESRGIHPDSGTQASNEVGSGVTERREAAAA